MADHTLRSHESDAETVFPGGSDMARRMRELDWSPTPLGAVETWPQSLRTSVSILLASGYPMYLAWGREYTEFYNDAFRPILGAKDATALGNSSRKTWSEIWDFIEPLFESVMTQGQTVTANDQQLFIERHGYLEEVYFDFSYSPIRVESSAVGGVFVTCAETTQRVLNDRRLRTLRDLGAAAEVGEPGTIWQNALAPLAGNPFDLPFALLYEVDADGQGASLVAMTGVQDEANATRFLDAAAWPLAKVIDGDDFCLVELDAELSSFASGPWPDTPPRTAVLLPVAQPGRERPLGVLVAGVSARRALDEAYREFLTLTVGQIANSIATARAFAEERRRAEALTEAATVLREGIEMREQFTSLVSHELRTPISVIMGNALLLQRRGGSLTDEIKNEIYGDMAAGARKLNDIVNGLLTLSRLDAGVRLVLIPVDLKATVVKAIDDFALRQPDRGVEVSYNATADIVQGDEALIFEVMENLLTNAVKYSPATTPIEVRVGDGPTPGTVEVTVRDRGPGVHEAELEQIFEAFYRSPKSSSQVGGAGLGLAVCKRIVEAHGGTIRVANQPNGGAAFTFTLQTGPGT